MMLECIRTFVSASLLGFGYFYTFTTTTQFIAGNKNINIEISDLIVAFLMFIVGLILTWYNTSHD